MQRSPGREGLPTPEPAQATDDGTGSIPVRSITTLIRLPATPAERHAGRPVWYGSRIVRVPAPGDPRDRRVA